MTRIYFMDADLFYIGDGVMPPEPTKLYTVDVIANGFYKAQYQGGIVNEETLEVTGGTWVETSGPSKEDYVAEAISIKAQLLAKVSILIAPLQDAVDLEEATPEEAARLKVLKTYRVQLNRVDTSLAPDIVWPTKPEGIE